MYFFSYLEPVCCFMSSSNCCFLTCIQVSQEAGQVVWYSHLFQNFPQFFVIHTVILIQNISLTKKIWKKKKIKRYYLSFQVDENFLKLSVVKATTGFPGDSAIKNPLAMQEIRFDLRVGKSLWSRKWQPAPVFLMENPMDRRAWGVTACGGARVRYDLTSKQQQQKRPQLWIN